MFGGQRRRGARPRSGLLCAVVSVAHCASPGATLTLRAARPSPGHTLRRRVQPRVCVGPLEAGSWRALIPRKARGPRVGPERLPRRARPPAGLGRAEFQLLPASSAAPVCVLQAPDVPSGRPAHVSCQPRARPRSPQSPGPLHTPNPDSPEGKSHWPRLPCLGRVCMPSH